MCWHTALPGPGVGRWNSHVYLLSKCVVKTLPCSVCGIMENSILEDINNDYPVKIRVPLLRAKNARTQLCTEHEAGFSLKVMSADSPLLMWNPFLGWE